MGFTVLKHAGKFMAVSLFTVEGLRDARRLFGDTFVFGRYGTLRLSGASRT
jgi:hypothetical protein